MGFRSIFVFVVFLCIPFDPLFYSGLFSIDWTSLRWPTLAGIASGLGSPKWVNLNPEDQWGLLSYINLLISYIISFLIAVIWSILDKKRRSYSTLFYWILVIARYRAAYGIIAWGYKKLIPYQMELPSISYLNTPFGDFRAQKLYWQGVGIAQHYEIFLGFAEVFAGILLLFRRTTSFGAALLFAILMNIALANHAYEGGVHVHSFTFALLGLIILWPQLPSIYQLLIHGHDAEPNIYYPSFHNNWVKYIRYLFKATGASVFVFFLFYLFIKDDLGYRFPYEQPILKNATGRYDVTEFRVNNQILPYSPFDSVRWQDAIFEKWCTLTFKVNRKQQMDLDNQGNSRKSIEMRFEYAGVGGGRHYFDYQIDTIKQLLYLQNKNRAHRDQQQILHYERPNKDRIILSGINEYKDSIYVVLDRNKHDYPLYQNRRPTNKIIRK
ncbi:hypothetical protein SAMN05216436_11487 [bacterium A37T11]|nr:hypothetical protein SAMN05216436_11487 [bacterium A37T11]